MQKRSKLLISFVVLILIVVYIYYSRSSKVISKIPEQQMISFEKQKRVVAILDTGVDFNRTILKDTKLAEYCFSEMRDGIKSLCENIDNGKNLDGAGKNCQLVLDMQCGHGTFVAGILANSIPNVKIVSYQIYSRLNKEIVITNANYLNALDHIINKKQSKEINFEAVNISWNYDDFFTDNCDDYKPETTQKIKTLEDLGVNVYVSTGNNYQKNKIAYPACITGVRTVSSRNAQGQIPNHSNSNGQVIYFGEDKIKSVYPDSDLFVESNGTSFSVPQIISQQINK